MEEKDRKSLNPKSEFRNSIEIEIPSQVRDDKDSRVFLYCHAELVSASRFVFALG